MRSQGIKRNYIIIALCMILVIMGVGYAAFSSMLNITGTANITNSWCIGFDNTKTNAYQSTPGFALGTSPVGTMSYTGAVCGSNIVSHADLSADFYQPGDQIIYTLTIKNKSSITAAIKSIKVDNQNVTSNTTITKGNIIYTVNMPSKTTLTSNEETTMTIVADFQDDESIGTGYTGETQTISVEINGQQDDGNGGFTPTLPKYTGTIYRRRWTYLANKGSSAASNYPYTITNLTEGTDYVKNASLLNKTYYLKYDIVNDEIINSYVCFVFDNSEHCMKGGDGEASFAANTQTIQDYQTFYNLNTVSTPSSVNPGCKFNSLSSSCIGGGFFIVFANSNGTVQVYGSSSEHCHVYDDGRSYCP